MWKMFWLLVIAALVFGWWVGWAAIVATGTAVLAALAVAFAVGTWPFWFVFAVAVAVTWFLVESEEEGGWAVVPFAVFCLFMHFISRFDLLAWGRENLGWLVWRAGEYLAIGFAYSLFRWVLHLRAKAREIDALEATYRKERPFDGPLEKASDDVKFGFAEFMHGKYHPDIGGHGYYNVAEEGVKPQFGRNALVQYRRFWWWPFSLVGWFCNRLIREAWELIKDAMRDLADWFSGLIFGKRADYVLSPAKAAELRRDRQRLEEEEYRRTHRRQE